MGGDGAAARGAPATVDVAERGATDDERRAAASLVIERACGDAFVALKDAGVAAILLKGPPQQAWLARAGTPRVPIDVDLLVDPSDAHTADNVLADRGYRLTPEVTPGVQQHSSVWTALGRVPVEIHPRLWGADGNPWPVLVRETESVVVGREVVDVPNEPARCLVVALHAAHHGIGQDATIYDLTRAVAVARHASWVRAIDLARAIGGLPAFTAGLGLVPSGCRLRADLGLDEPELTGSEALDLATPNSGAAGYFWLSQQRGIRRRALFVSRKIIPPADFMRFKYIYARRGRAHLALAYGYRLLWLARWSVPGLMEWRRIRSTAPSARHRR